MFFNDYNGLSVFHDRYWVSIEDVELFTDRMMELRQGKSNMAPLTQSRAIKRLNQSELSMLF